ncbi:MULTISPECIES: cupin domain-containing protein [Novosphingobium]|uniref:Cupin domain-containing protein n=1 Tax=Novosphingobium mangrovi (ex Hu et al. 2023) TaxID=2930094 RepID=A0ABT0AEH3_9SPHN|nr:MULTISPECIES: cupin domain-containing protein [Novosphingobium]MCJ1961582.1 cupin domain-containing protein [Novosphingobium mangrovi (ex Hu et al. 2023)]MED5544532.1 cupin domain-containing protein [Pseudomonadota bacterium]
MKVIRAGTNPSAPAGPDATFTGRVRRDPLVNAEAPGRVLTGTVSFEPCARTDWHTHPLGQILIVTAGCGWVQAWEQAKQVIRPGDVVWTPPGEKHWHGATETTAMTHIAVTEALDGKAVDWLEKVSDAQYRGPAVEP